MDMLNTTWILHLAVVAYNKSRDSNICLTGAAIVGWRDNAKRETQSLQKGYNAIPQSQATLPPD